MTTDSRAETGIWVRNYEEAASALAAPIKVRGFSGGGGSLMKFTP